MADSHSARTKAFISYSHKDEKHLERLHIHLEPYRRERKLDVWDDTHITPGARWRGEIRAAIAAAKIAILLVSADFLASEFIAKDELPPLLEAAEKDGLLIFLIILSPCAFQDSKLERYQAFNKPSEPLLSKEYWQQEEVWAKLAKKVADALRVEPSRNEPDAFISSHKQTTAEPLQQTPRLKVENIRRISQLVGHEQGLTALAFSPDNQILVSGDAKGKVYVWDIAEKTFFVPKYPISFSTRLTRGLNNIFFSAATGTHVRSIAFHPGGKTFCVGWADGDIKLFQCPSGTYLLPFLSSDVEGVTALAVSPDGLVLVQAGYAERYQRAVVPERGQRDRPARSSLTYYKYPKMDTPVDENDYSYISEFKFYDCDEVTCSITFSPKGHFFAASSSTGTIRIWDIAQRNEQPSLTNIAYSRDRFINVIFHPGEQLVAAINKEGQCILWDRATGSIQNTFTPVSGTITAIAFSPDGLHLAAAHSSGVIGFWNLVSGKVLFSFKAHDQSITALAYSSDGYHLVSGSEDRTIKVWGNAQN